METSTNDVKIKILLKLDYFDILLLTSVNKDYRRIHDGNDLFQLMLKRDYNITWDDEDAIMSEVYKSMFMFYDKWTLKIVCSFIEYKTKYRNIMVVYKEIKRIIIEYQKNVYEIDWEEDEKNYYGRSRELDLRTYYLIFDVLSVDINKNLMINDIRPPRALYRYSDVDKMSYMASIFEGMSDEYVDITCE
jgi:hypothetical protein